VSSASAWSRLSLARSIRSNTSGEDSWEARGGGPGGSTRAWCRRPDCTCLALGWRLDLLTWSRMRAGC